MLADCMEGTGTSVTGIICSNFRSIDLTAS